MKQTISIEWRHFDKEGRTCARCADTGTALRRVVAILEQECGCVGFRFIETKLNASAITESNSILVDGRRIEELLPELRPTETECGSCGDLIGEPANCRALELNAELFETVPEQWIRTAVCRVAQCCQ